MKLKSLACSVVLSIAMATTVVSAAAAVAQPPAYSTNSTIGELLDNPDAKAVVEKHVPGVFADSQVEHGRDLQFSFLAGNRPGMTPELMARINADLAKVVRKSPAQAPLPPEARAAVLAAEIDDALESRNEALALAKLKALDAIPAARPSGLYLTEAKLARRAEDYPRARVALDRYFNAVKPDDSSYGEATREKARQDALVADEATAWTLAQVSNNCAGYVKYLNGPTKLKKSADTVLERMDSIGCAGAAGLPESVSKSLVALHGLQVTGHSAGQAIKDCRQCPEMVVVKGGSFTMGSADDEMVGHPLAVGGRDPNEGPQHRVSIKSFAAGKYEVTFDEWAACVTDGGCSRYSPADNSWGRGRHPVINVSWEDAQAYVRWLSAKAGKTYRLLSEAEWEYVARAGTTTPFWTGGSITASQANFNSQIATTQPVGSYATNPFGLFDTAGNVWEWVEDCWNGSHDGAPRDGSARTTSGCSQRGLRGASWVDAPLFLRSAMRVKAAPKMRFFNIGFRVARTL